MVKYIIDKEKILEENRKRGFFATLFSPIKWILSLINNYFKSFLFLLLLYLLFGDNVSDKNLVQPNLVSIDIHGTIMDSKDILEKINKAKDDTNIKGVLLHVNSPGGALAPSVEIAYAIKDLKDKKYVVAYGAGAMVSGSYYASIWSNKIIANPGGFVGSIGVIFQSYNAEELMNKIGLKAQTIKAGKFKEAGTYTREWTPQEEEALQKLIDSSYSLFISDVARARDLNISDKAIFADAKVFLSYDAKKVGLIDEVGTLSDAQNSLIALSGVKNPVWEKPDKFDIVVKKITSQSVKTLIDALYGLKAY